MATNSVEMTVEEFNLQVNKWALRIAREAKDTLRANTQSSGNLANRIARFVDKKSNDEPAYKIKFQFDRYGVFRAYGAGRGYVVKNGQILKGFRIRSVADIRNKVWNDAARRYLRKGYSRTEVNTMKVYQDDGGSILRSKLDWIDVHISGSIEQLADLCQEYYGDDAVRQILRDIDKLKIVKKNGK